MIALTVIIENMYIPLKHSKLNEQIEESDRATILSIYSLITNMLTIITSLAFGYYSNISIDNALLLSMIFVFTGWILYKISTKNISKIYFLLIFFNLNRLQIKKMKKVLVKSR